MKNKSHTENENIDIATVATAQKLLEETDTDSRTRTYTKPLDITITILLCAWTVFQLYFSTIGVMSAVSLRAFHCVFLLFFTFLIYPATKKENRNRKVPRWFDFIFIAATVFAFGYLIMYYTRWLTPCLLLSIKI